MAGVGYFKLELRPICLPAVWPVSVSYRHLLVGMVWYVRYFLYCEIWRELHFVKFCGNFPQEGGLVHQKGAEASKKGVPVKCKIPKNPYQVFLWYWLVKYQENSDQYQTEIPN